MTNHPPLAVLSGSRDAPGPCVVFIHGILGSANFWPAILPEEILNSIRWISVGLPGHFPTSTRNNGASGTASETPEQYAHLMMRAVEAEIGDAPAMLAGWSTGGFACLNLAANFPDRFQRMLTVAGFSRGKWGGLLGALQTVLSGGPLVRFAGRQVLKAMQRSRSAYVLANAKCAADRAAFKQNLADLRSGYSDFQQHSVASLAKEIRRIRAFDITPRLREIVVPTTLVVGVEDRVIPFEHSQTLHALLKHSTLVPLEGCGHMFFAERGPEFRALFEQWLTDESQETTCLHPLKKSA